MLQSYNPNNAETLLVWAVSRSLAATKEITIVFSSSGYLDVSVHQVRARHCASTVGCPIRKSPDQNVFAIPRSLSQLTTSFIAFKHQIIHQWLLVA